MNQERAITRAEDEAVLATRAGTTAGELFARVVAALAPVIAIDGACGHVLDPATAMRSGSWSQGHTLEDSETAGRLQFGAEAVGRSFASLTRRADPVVVLSQQPGGNKKHGAWYRELYEPVGLGDGMRAVCVQDGVPWGDLSLLRDRGRPDFDEHEANLLARISPHQPASRAWAAAGGGGGARADRP